MIKSKFNSEHYVWGNNCDGYHLLKSDKLSVIFESMPPKTFEKPHFHTHSQQVFYILSGVASFKLAEQEYELNVGDSIHVPVKLIHSIENRSALTLEFLVISEPKSHVDRVEAKDS
ncbi:MAG: cupin domain-containing protein [Opitutaceae bacterium]|nr:cupin domain-containing protein [Cytophagales bacterium]